MAYARALAHAGFDLADDFRRGGTGRFINQDDPVHGLATVMAASISKDCNSNKVGRPAVRRLAKRYTRWPCTLSQRWPIGSRAPAQSNLLPKSQLYSPE